MSTSTSSTATRVDAVRNRERLLAAAAELFEKKGSVFSVDEVAAHAGVGTGTFYRNFPTKAALLGALVGQQLDELALGEDGDAGTAIMRFVSDAITGSRRKHDLVAALEAAGYTTAGEIAEASARFRARLGELLERAQADRMVRADLELDDLLALVSAASVSASRDGASGEHIAAVIRDGIAGSRSRFPDE